MFIGIFIVCLASPKPKGIFSFFHFSSFFSFSYLGRKCQLNFISPTNNLIEYNYGPRSIAIGYFNNETLPDIRCTVVIFFHWVLSLCTGCPESPLPKVFLNISIILFDTINYLFSIDRQIHQVFIHMKKLQKYCSNESLLFQLQKLNCFLTGIYSIL